MADPREKDDGAGAIVLQNPNDPVPQPKIILPDGSVVEGKDLADMTDDELAALVDDLDDDEDDLSDLDDPLPDEE